MKKFILLCAAVFIVAIAHAQEPVKAFGPINFGMTKAEIKKAAKASEQIKWTMNQFTTEILGDKYFGAMDFEKKKIVRLWLHHYPGSIAAFSRNYNSYNGEDLERDINELITFLTELYGNPAEPAKFVHPGEIYTNSFAIVGTWNVMDEKIIMLIERDSNALSYPQIAVISKEYYDRSGKDYVETKKEDKEKTKSMF